MEIEISAKQRKALRRVVRNNDYHLLLGAGASREARSKSGQLLPTGGQLSARLAERFTVPFEDGDLLWRVYARAIEEHGKNAVFDWLSNNFWYVKPPDWMKIYANSPWSIVWTLNIDDVFENAYDEVSTEDSKSLLTLNWNDPYRRTRDLPVVHLHGYVDPTSTRELVFSLSEYASSALTRAAWPLNFRDTYGVYPFVIIGARLRDEPDIESVIADRSPSNEAPSFYVSPDISAATERDLRRWNLIPVRMTAEQFTTAWIELTGLKLNEPPTSREAVSGRVYSQFRELKFDSSKAQLDHDFIGGDEPDVTDIQLDLFTEFNWVSRAIDDCKKMGTGYTEPMMIYVGNRLTGRSTGLLAIAKALRALSWRTFLFRGEERPDIDAITKLASDGRSIALLFDSVYDVADDVNKLLSLTESANLKVICVAVDHVDQSAGIVDRVDRSLILRNQFVRISDSLNKSDSYRLVDKLESIGRLGILETKRYKHQRVSHFKDQSLFGSMAQLENAPGFGRRVNELVEAINDEDHLTLLFLAALASRFGRRFHARDASRMLGVESDAVIRMIRSDSQLSAVLRIEDSVWVKTRQRWMALESCIRKLGSKKALSKLSLAMQRVASRLNHISQRERNTTSLLVGQFMIYKNVSNLFPSEDLDQWYQSLSTTFGSWSARYWEQRAIMNRTAGKKNPHILSKAESFALRAVSITRDPYSLTTLGTVLLTKAAFVPGVNIVEYYDRAFDVFDEASESVPNNFVTWRAFLQYSLLVLSPNGKVLRNLDPELIEHLIDDWERMYALTELTAGASEELLKDLRKLHSQFQKIAQPR